MTAPPAAPAFSSQFLGVPIHSRLSPPRSYWVVQGIFLLLGIGILAPWNAFISAKDYFDKRLCDETGNLESKFSLIYNLASVASLGLLILIQTVAENRSANIVQEESSSFASDNKNPESDCILDQQNGIIAAMTAKNDDYVTSNDSERQHHQPKKDHSFFLVMLPLALYLVAFLGQALMVRVIQMPFFLLFTFMGLALCGMACGIAQAGIVATAGLFHSNVAMNAYMAGMSLGGVAVSSANFLAAVLSDPKPYWISHCVADRLLLPGKCQAYQQVDEAVFLYFLLGSATLGLCMVGFSHVVRIIHCQDQGTYGLIVGEPVDPDTTPRIGLELPVHQNEFHSHVGERDEVLSTTTNEMLLQVWNQIQVPAVAIFLVFTITLSLFPAWTSQIRSHQQCQSTFRLRNDLFTPMSFVLFNVGDFTGRLLSSRIPLPSTQNRSQSLMTLAGLRCIFYILFFLCPGGENRNVYMHSDLYTVLVIILFAVSNGYILSAAFCHAPSLVASLPEHQERMAEILSFSVSIGLLVGSLLSFPVIAFNNG